MANYADGYLDLATTLKKQDQVREACRAAMKKNPAWQAPGELLLAVLDRREGNEKPLIAVAQKYESDAAFAAQLQPAAHFLRNEIAQATSRSALELAFKLWQPQAAAETGGNTYSTTRTAEILAKLDRRDEARQLVLDAAARPFVLNYNTDADSLVQQHVNQRTSLAQWLASHQFPADALAVYAGVEEIDTSGLQPNSYALRQVQEANQAGRRLVEQVLNQQADAALDRLEADLTKEQDRPNLAPYFTAFDAAPVSGVNSIPQSPTANRESAKSDSLLPALLEDAQKKGRLDKIARLLADARKRHPDDAPLAALDVLIAFVQDRGEEALAGVKAIAEKIEADPAEAAAPSVWIVARAALQREPTRELGEKLAEAVAESAAKKKNRARQGSAVALAAESLRARGKAEEADALLQRLLLGDNPQPEAVLQLAQVYHRDGKSAAAAAALASIWSKSPELLLARLEQVTPIYLRAKKIDELAKALRLALGANGKPSRAVLLASHQRRLRTQEPERRRRAGRRVAAGSGRFRAGPAAPISLEPTCRPACTTEPARRSV
jgi:hypothetical protein